jgi:dihydrodipicolinate synthase/N-acetylneuraminate lyase
MHDKQEDRPPAIVPNRRITAMSAVLLPLLQDGTVDWDVFDSHLRRTCEAGLIPAINMDTGSVHLLDNQTRLEVLQHTNNVLSGKSFVAGAYIADKPGDKWNSEAYQHELDLIQKYNATPVILQSFGLTNQGKDEIVASYQTLAKSCNRFIAFELGSMFAPFGKIYDLQTFTAIMHIKECIGAKHSSLSRRLEWQRLRLRDEQRPDFMILTGNDLAIDMVIYGSDYLLGLSTFAPDAFGLRDSFWQQGDPRFYELNDLLQFLGFFAFRQPVPAYKHSAAQFLRLRGWLKSDELHHSIPKRPNSDVPILKDILERLNKWLR